MAMSKPRDDRRKDLLLPASAMKLSYEIIFALDPSPDDTQTVILEEINRNLAIKLILFSRRYGQPAAMAGILNCTGQKCVVIDVDLQDPPELTQLYDKLAAGYEVVYAMRTSREVKPLSCAQSPISAVP
jgi:glycosyltransferase involved in cell wall biosynthesis